MTKQEKAKAKRARKAARGPGFSNYSKGIPTPHQRKALARAEAVAKKKPAEKPAE